MSITLTVESFITGTKQSGLVEERLLDEVVAEAAAQGRPYRSATDLSETLVERKLVTRWQAEKLLQGKYRGFLLGRYQLKELLGKGEMSSVYLAEHVRMKRQCAIKVLPAHKVRETSYLGRFHREAEAVAQLNHPNIVRAYDVDVEEDGGAEIHFLVMEYVVGRSVEKRVSDDGVMPIVEAADVIRQAATGLAHAHAAGLVHRDIKPGNLLIDEHGVVRVLDLGLARFFKDQDRESLTIKHDEKVLGTADYLAPEQAVDSHAVDERADIYALGCTLFFALTGRPPFTDGTLVQRLLAHQTQTPPSVTSLREDCPLALAEMIQKMMAKEPSSRYQTAEDVAHVFAAFLVEHGGRQWREEHVEVVAKVRGVDALLEPPSGDVPTNTGKAAGKPKQPRRKKQKKRAQSSKPSSAPATKPQEQPKSPAVEPVASQKKAPEASFTKAEPEELAEPTDVRSSDPELLASRLQAPEPKGFAAVWRRLDKQLVAIVALLAVSALFIASVTIQARAVDEETPPLMGPETSAEPESTEETDSDETSTPTVEPNAATINPPVDLGDVSDPAL